MNINLEQTMAMSQQMEARQQQFTGLDQMQAWKRNPLGQMVSRHPVFTQMTMRIGGRQRNLGGLLKEIRDTQILTESEDPVLINVLGPNGGGKGVLCQGIAKWLIDDQYLQDASREMGFRVVPLVEMFATTIKAAQIPEEAGGPGLIPPDVPHGGFTAEQYALADEYAFRLRKVIMHLPRKGTKLVLITERPAPTARPAGRDYPPQVVGVNRALGSMYADAYNPRYRGTTNFLIVKPDSQVRSIAADERDGFQSAGETGDNPLTTHTKYWVTSKAGIIRDAAELHPNIQQDVIDLLRLGTAPRQAIYRANGEMQAITDSLFAEGRIKEPTLDAYLAFLRRQLISSNPNTPGLPRDQVHMIENIKISGRPEYHLDNLLRLNVTVSPEPYRNYLVGEHLRNYAFGS